MNKIRITFIVACLALVVGGCSQTDISQIEDLQSVSLFSRGDQLPRVMSYINSRSQYEPKAFQKNVVSGLNRWASNMADEDLQEIEWQEPDWISSLPDQVANDKSIKELNSLTFVPYDANYIQEISWLNSLNERILESSLITDFNWLIYAAKQQMSESEITELADSRDPLADVLSNIHADLDQEQATQMASVLRIFDWTIRNIQYEPEVEWLAGDALTAVSTLPETELGSTQWPPAAGAPGPGYRRFPWQLLTYGRGDGLERANLFMGLLNQANIDCLMLAINSEEGSESTRPYTEWLPAVFIGEQLYLFDTHLGLPLPGNSPGQIATLNDVRANPELLKQLDLTVDESLDKEDYRVTSADLERLVGLVNVSPESVSRRMTLLERKLFGDLRLNLTRDPSSVLEKAANVEGINEVSVWHVPFASHQYRSVVNDAIALAYTGDQSIIRKLSFYIDGESYIDQFASFRAAKNHYIRGRFETPRDDPGLNAINAFNLYMYTDQEITNFQQDTLLQRDLGIFKPNGQSYQEWKLNLANMKEQMYKVRADASFYLALSHYENGYPSTALNWLERINAFDNEGRWSHAVNYQKARAHEAGGNFEDAVTMLMRKGSPQRAGNVIRARMLKQLIDAEAS